MVTERIEQRRKQELDIQIENLLRQKTTNTRPQQRRRRSWRMVASGEQSRDNTEAAVAQ